MAIIDTDIKYWLSGGASNTNQHLSLGGARSTTTQITDNTLHNAFNLADGTEAAAGSVKFRSFYVENDHATLTLFSAKIFISQDSTGTQDEVDIALDGAGKNGVAEVLTDENDVPTGEVFTHPTTYAGGLVLGDMVAQDVFPFIERRTINVGANAFDNSTVKIRVQGDTPA
jgi:hypothetical protein